MIARKGLVGWTLSALCVVAVLVGGVRRAEAQAWAMTSLMQPPVTSAEMERLVEMIDADEAQEAVIRDLFQGFLGKHEQASERIREILRMAQQEAEQDPTVWRDIQRKFIEFYAYQQEIRENLFADVRLVLSPEQTEQWPAFERYHRRQHLLDDQQTIVSGARVDLVRLLDDIVEEDAPPVEGMADLARRYEIELDRLLREKERMSQEQLKEMLEIMEEGGDFMSQMPRWEEMFIEGRELQVKIRNVNEKYLRQISSRLEPEVGAEFDREYARRAMPNVYAKTYVDKAFEAAEGFESLTEDQREQLTALRQEYEREADAIRDKWADALREWQTEVKMTDLFGSQSGGPEAIAQRDAKQDLDERFYERVRSMLSEEQRASLPEREKDWRRAGGFGFGD